MIAVQTDRLIVRRLGWDDLDDFAYLTGHPDVARYMDNGEPLTREQTQKWIEVSLQNYEIRGWGCFGITLVGEDRLIGFGGFARPPHRPGIVELIYAFAPHYWGLGYATEAAAAIVRFGFEQCGLTRIEATVDPANHASKHVLEKIGMIFSGQFLDEDDDPVDLYAIGAKIDDGEKPRGKP